MLDQSASRIHHGLTLRRPQLHPLWAVNRLPPGRPPKLLMSSPHLLQEKFPWTGPSVTPSCPSCPSPAWRWPEPHFPGVSSQDGRGSSPHLPGGSTSPSDGWRGGAGVGGVRGPGEGVGGWRGAGGQCVAARGSSAAAGRPGLGLVGWQQGLCSGLCHCVSARWRDPAGHTG